MVSQVPMAGANHTAALSKKSNRIAQVLAYALLLANGIFSTSSPGSPPSSTSRLRARSAPASASTACSTATHTVASAALSLCDAHAAELSRLGYCSAHRRLADAGDMCEDCAAAAAPGKALLSWMSRSELGERDLACACCGVALETSSTLRPSCSPRRRCAAQIVATSKRKRQRGQMETRFFVSEEGPVIFDKQEAKNPELFDEKPLLGDNSTSVLLRS
ncbi:hypothetical protein SETIT_1G303100v2 [Setaria italica]|uniref:Uncharacterized protein n=1 Tax=Setaria italica TaxID=4555 RepID=A0A368PQT7_SETIT|nr:hypothetical protein SETIT_1G303100v2 [Setaria italica]